MGAFALRVRARLSSGDQPGLIPVRSFAAAPGRPHTSACLRRRVGHPHGRQIHMMHDRARFTALAIVTGRIQKSLSYPRRLRTRAGMDLVSDQNYEASATTLCRRRLANRADWPRPWRRGLLSVQDLETQFRKPRIPSRGAGQSASGVCGRGCGKTSLRDFGMRVIIRSPNDRTAPACLT